METLAPIIGGIIWVVFAVITANFIKTHLCDGEDPSMDSGMAWFFAFCWPLTWIIGGIIWLIGMLVGLIASPFVKPDNSEDKHE